MEREYYMYNGYPKNNDGYSRSEQLFSQDEMMDVLSQINSEDEEYIYRLATFEEMNEDFDELNLPRRGKGEFDFKDFNVIDSDNGYYFIEDRNEIEQFISNHKKSLYASSFTYCSIVFVKEKRPAAKLKISVVVRTKTESFLNFIINLDDVKMKTNGLTINKKNHFPKSSIDFIIENSEKDMIIYLKSGAKIYLNVQSSDEEDPLNYITLKEVDYKKIQEKFNSIILTVMNTTF